MEDICQQGCNEFCMMDQRQELELILSCQRSLKLKWGCIKDLCRYLFAVVVDTVAEFAKESDK